MVGRGPLPRCYGFKPFNSQCNKFFGNIVALLNALTQYYYDQLCCVESAVVATFLREAGRRNFLALKAPSAQFSCTRETQAERFFRVSFSQQNCRNDTCHSCNRVAEMIH